MPAGASSARRRETAARCRVARLQADDSASVQGQEFAHHVGRSFLHAGLEHPQEDRRSCCQDQAVRRYGGSPNVQGHIAQVGFTIPGAQACLGKNKEIASCECLNVVDFVLCGRLCIAGLVSSMSCANTAHESLVHGYERRSINHTKSAHFAGGFAPWEWLS